MSGEIRILEERRWPSGAFAGIRCKVCGAMNVGGRYGGDLDDVLGFPHKQGCPATDVVVLTPEQREALRSALEAYLASVAGCHYSDGPIADRLREIRESVPAFFRCRTLRELQTNLPWTALPPQFSGVSDDAQGFRSCALAHTST